MIEIKADFQKVGFYVLKSVLILIHMQKISFTFILTLLFFSCSDNSNQQPKEKAARLTQQADDAINRQNYEEAERLLMESINIYSESNNEAKLTENYSTLSSTQILSGKLSPAIESLISLRGFYRHIADRNSELQTMIQIGNLYFQLGRTKESIAILSEVFSSSQLYRLEPLRAKAAVAIASVHIAVDQNETALQFLTSAATFYTAQHDIPRLLETESSRINALVSIGKVDEAYETYKRSMVLLQSNPSVTNEPLFFLQCGESFAKAGESSFAKSCFDYGLTLIESQKRYQHSKQAKHLYIGLGELYFRNFAFGEAEEHFTKAYEIAKNEPDGIVLGYLLIRIADCSVKLSAYHNDNLNGKVIRAIQYYEQSLTHFARAGFGFGEAIALHRIGMVRQLSKDDNAAITFYKRAFEKFLQNNVPTAFFSLSVNINLLCSTISQTNNVESWFSDNLISLLLNYKKFSEAIAYYETVRNIKLQSEVGKLHLVFRDKGKDKWYSSLQRSLAEKNSLQLELFRLNTLLKPNRNYALKLHLELKYVQSKISSDVISFAQEFPVFSFLNSMQKSSLAGISEALPPATTVLEYCFAGNELWVFVLKNNEEVSAIKLSSFAYSLMKRMNRFIDIMQHSATLPGNVQLEAGELYSFLIQPVESFGRETFTVLPPIGMDKFPFHILLKNERPLIELMEVTYLPCLSFIHSNQSKNSTLHSGANIAAFGFTTDSRWGLEFELRDIRSFFKNTQVNVNLVATAEKLYNATGTVLQLSTPYQKNGDAEYSFLLSSGSTLKSGVNLSIEKFTSYHSFPIVYLSDVQSSANNISILHPLLWMLNGSSSVIATQFPLTSNVSKSFSENLYSSLLSEETPSGSYRRSVTLLERKKDLYGGFAGASYFYYGMK